MLEWWEAAQADPEHVLFLHYEDMLKDPEGNIRKIAQFAGIEHTDETIAKVRDPNNPFSLKSDWFGVVCRLKYVWQRVAIQTTATKALSPANPMGRVFAHDFLFMQ